jgi:hypothetical protein
MQMTVIITWTNSKRAQMQQIAGFRAHFSLPLSKEDFGAPIHSVRGITEAVSLPGFDVVVRPSPDLGATARFGGEEVDQISSSQSTANRIHPFQIHISTTRSNSSESKSGPFEIIVQHAFDLPKWRPFLSFSFVISPQFPRRQINHFSLSQALFPSIFEASM